MSLPVLPADGFDIDFQSSAQVDFAVLENQFGDGYTQRAGDGENNMRDTWTANWTNLRTSENDELVTFFRSLKGYLPFLWQAPGDSTQKKWSCRSFKFTPVDAGHWTVNATLRQEFDP